MRTDKDRNFIDSVFSSVSENYDLMNDLTSFGLHRKWKDSLVNIINVEQGSIYADMSCGTGDILIKFLKKNRNKISKTYAIDPSFEMLEIAKDKIIDSGLSLKDIQFINSAAEDSSKLPQKVDICTLSFGARNFSDIEKSFINIFNMLNEGGRFYCMEFSPKLRNQSIDFIYKKYLDIGLPMIGKFFAKNEDSYKYLSNSIKGFLDSTEVIELLRKCGFSNIDVISLAFGGVNIYYGKK